MDSRGRKQDANTYEEVSEDEGISGNGNTAKTSKRGQGRKRKTREENDTEGAKPVKRVRGKRGLLKLLVEMPMDMLFEIFGQLDPVDLLQMARTTKTLRAILMSRSSVSVWRSARSNIVGLPDCPDDLSEAQYAALMFVNKCSFCHKALSVIHISWYGRVRCCNKCLKANCIQTSGMVSSWAYQSSYPFLLAKWIPFIHVIRETHNRRGDTVIRQSNFILNEQNKQWKLQHAALEDPKSQYEWLLRTLQVQYVIAKHARECALWHKARQSNESSQRIQEIFDRHTQVMNCVKEIGFEEDLYKLPPSETNPLDSDDVQDLLRSPEAIHEISPAVKDLFQRSLTVLKQSRQHLEYQEFIEMRKRVLSVIYDAGIKTLPINSPYPSLAQVYHIAEDHDLMDYSKTAEEALRVPFEEVVALWQKHVHGKLSKLIATECGSEYVFDPVTVFDLATTSFSCRACGMYSRNKSLMRHEQAMIHSCTGYNSDTSDSSRVFHAVFGDAIWSDVDGQVRFQLQHFKTIQKLVEMCGLDPKMATYRQMNELEPIFECRPCNDINQGRATMTWTAALTHQLQSHMDNLLPDTHFMRVLGEPEATIARERIREEQARATYQSRHCNLVCPHCRAVVQGMASYRKHLKQQHEISNIKYEELIFSLKEYRVPPMFRLWPPLDEDSINSEA